MSEQALDLQTAFAVLRRHRLLLIVVTLLGVAVGAVLVRVHPPQYSSTTQVLLPRFVDPSGSGAGRDVATDIRVATSDVVLDPAGRSLDPPRSAAEVRRRTSVSAPTENVLEIECRGATAAEAEALAEAVANAEVEYQRQALSSVSQAQAEKLAERSDALKQQESTVDTEIDKTRQRLQDEPTSTKAWHSDSLALARLTAEKADLVLQIDALKEQATPTPVGGEAQVIEHPSPARRSRLGLYYASGMAGAGLVAFLLAALVLTALGRRDRRLRTRDEIADALGSAVIASVRARPQRAAAGWVALMEAYEPSVTEAWSLRQALDHVGIGELTVHGSGDASRRSGTSPRPRTLTLITLSDDFRALAVGPQLASHAASLGIRTRLVAGQGHQSSAALWAACATFRRDSEVRPGLFVDTRKRKMSNGLTVEMVVVDRKNPQFLNFDRGSVTVLAVSSSSATAEDLARTAVAAYEFGGRITGVVVADPDGLDRTTGRLLLQQRSEQVQLPTRMTGVNDPSKRSTGGNAR
jgi:capsular polysaccharide biosynthesis protein